VLFHTLLPAGGSRLCVELTSSPSSSDSSCSVATFSAFIFGTTAPPVPDAALFFVFCLEPVFFFSCNITIFFPELRTNAELKAFDTKCQKGCAPGASTDGRLPFGGFVNSCSETFHSCTVKSFPPVQITSGSTGDQSAHSRYPA